MFANKLNPFARTRQNQAANVEMNHVSLRDPAAPRSDEHVDELQSAAAPSPSNNPASKRPTIKKIVGLSVGALALCGTAGGIGLAIGEDGYSQVGMERQIEALMQVVNVMHPNFKQFTLRAFDSSANFVAAVAAGKAGLVHASISIDPGLDGIFTVDVCWHANLVARYAGRPGAILAVAYAVPGLAINRPEQAPIGEYQHYVEGRRDPAEFVGCDDEPGAEAGLAEYRALKGPVVLWRSLHPAQFVGLRWELTQAMRQLSRYHVAALVATSFVGLAIGWHM